MRPLPGLLAFVALAVAAYGTSSGDEVGAGAPPQASELESLRENLPALKFDHVAVDPSRTANYFGWYGLDSLPESHFFGSFSAGQQTLAAHAFLPDSARGTVILVHGYLDHVGSHGATIRHLLERGYAVAAYDLPGHGLSSGERGAIDDFADYGAGFRAFVDLCLANMPQPCHVVAHSLGAAIVIDYLIGGARDERDKLGEIVLIAPLIHSARWGVSKTTASMLRPFVDVLPRVSRDNTSDEQYEAFVRQDPLQPRRVSVDWFEALVDWSKRIVSSPPSPRRLTIIQGDADSVVDWEFNLAALRKLFPAASVASIAGGKHQLLNEAPALRTKVLQIVDAALDTQ